MKEILSISPVIPVIELPDNVDPVKLAQALEFGGIRVVEVALDSDQALTAIQSIRDSVRGMCVGAGTIWSAEDANKAIDRGANFVVSPGYSVTVHDVCAARDIPYMPGVQTVTEAAACVAAKLTTLNFFPASIAGGPAAILAMNSVLPDIEFCPKGGISLESAAGYLRLPNVPCVGGTWMVEKSAMINEDWIGIHSAVETTLKSLAGNSA